MHRSQRVSQMGLFLIHFYTGTVAFSPPNAQVQGPPACDGRLASRPGIIDIGKRRLRLTRT